METFDKYNGCPTTIPSTPCVNNFPKLFLLTLLGVSRVSFALTPVRALSLWYVTTLTWASAEPGRIKAARIIEAATRADLWKEFRTDGGAMNLQTGSTHIYVSTSTSPLRKAAESGSEPGLAGEEDASLQQSGCPERRDKSAMPGAKAERCRQYISILWKSLGTALVAHSADQCYHLVSEPATQAASDLHRR